ncbi:glycosyltransferase [Pelomonas sp. CA6]|uniref:glycosyltransferase family 2 protein n=1 Tax=Pelomonas sp. CA6 TaxID=2907999 RepID=UPI001F4BF95E|nr:glycosyltransferase [Pelomonas sp. CA6]MCH7345213.1 glycosyltransferase [Pelomonas sp. CA6]
MSLDLDPTPTLLISVVIPTRARPRLLERCLQSLVRQSLHASRYEIIVVDDGHQEEVAQLCAQLAEDAGAPRIRCLRSPQPGAGPAAARNGGWRAARAALIAFTDDDTLADHDWLLQGVVAMRGGWVALAGQVRVPRSVSGDQRPTDHELMTRGLERAEFVTANAFVRREALECIEGFDERFRRAWREDADLQFRLEALGRVGRCPAALVWHPVRPEPWGVSLRQQRNVFFDALLYRKHPRQYRERVRRRPPWNYYLTVLLAVATPLLALTGRRDAALVALGALLGLVLGFALTRLQHTARDPAHVLEMLATSAAIPFLSVYWRLRGAFHFRALFL